MEPTENSPLKENDYPSTKIARQDDDKSKEAEIVDIEEALRSLEDGTSPDNGVSAEEYLRERLSNTRYGLTVEIGADSDKDSSLNKLLVDFDEVDVRIRNHQAVTQQLKDDNQKALLELERIVAEL